MNKFLARLSFAAIAVGAIWVAGCDSSKKSTSQLTPGDPDSQEYAAFEDAVAGINETSTEMISGVLEQANMIIEMGSSSASKDRSFPNQYASASTDSFSAVYNSDKQYWFTYWSLTTSGSGATITYHDSIQFLQGDSPVQWPDTTTLTEIRCGQSMVAGLEDDSNTISISAGSGWSLKSSQGPLNNSSEIVVNGSTDQGLSASSLAAGCDMSLTVTSSHVNVTTPISELAAGETCPSTGSIQIAGTFATSCEGDNGSGSINGTWNWQATFDNGNVMISANNGHFTWGYNGVCPPQD